MVCLLFTQRPIDHENVLTTSTADGMATELVLKWISKKVTKYLLLLNTFTGNFVFLYYCKMYR